MRRNGRLLIVLGVTLALAAVALAVFALAGGDKGKETDTIASSQPKDIFVVQVKRDIPAHTLLTKEDVEEVKVSNDTVSADSVRSVGEAIGFAYSSDLSDGQVLMRTNLEQPGLSNELTGGTRAISLPVDKNNLVGGLLREDDHIDVVFAISVELTRVLPTEPIELPDDLTLRDIATTLPPYGESPGATYPFPGEEGSRFTISDTLDGDPQAKLILQNLRVLRVVTPDTSGTGGSQSSSNDSSYLVVEVNPQQAELLTYMLNNGKFSVVLRGTDDTSDVTTTGINLERMVNDNGFPYPKTIRVPGPGAQ